MELIPRIQEGGVFKNKQAINNLRDKEQLQDSKDFDVYHFTLELILTGRFAKPRGCLMIGWKVGISILSPKIMSSWVVFRSHPPSQILTMRSNITIHYYVHSALHTVGEPRFNEWLTVIITSQQSVYIECC